MPVLFTTSQTQTVIRKLAAPTYFFLLLFATFKRRFWTKQIIYGLAHCSQCIIYFISINRLGDVPSFEFSFKSYGDAKPARHLLHVFHADTRRHVALCATAHDLKNLNNKSSLCFLNKCDFFSPGLCLPWFTSVRNTVEVCKTNCGNSCICRASANYTLHSSFPLTEILA